MQQFNRKLLPLAGFMMAVDKAEAASGKVDVVFPEARLDGAEFANKLHSSIKSDAGTQNEMFLHVCKEYDSYDEATDGFLAGFKIRATYLATTGNMLDKRAAKLVGEFSSRLQRVINARFGMPKKTEAGTMAPWFGFVEEGEPHIKGAAVTKLFEGAGYWADKLGSLPSFSKAGAPKANTKGETPQQVRYAAVENLPPEGSADALATVLGVPSKVKGKDIDTKKRTTIAMQGLTAAIRACPDDGVEKVVLATITRCRLSAMWSGFAADMQKRYEELANAEDSELAQSRLIKGERQRKTRKLVKKEQA